MGRECQSELKWPLPVWRNQMQKSMTARVIDLRRVHRETIRVFVSHGHSVLEPLTPCAAQEYYWW